MPVLDSMTHESERPWDPLHQVVWDLVEVVWDLVENSVEARAVVEHQVVWDLHEVVWGLHQLVKQLDHLRNHLEMLMMTTTPIQMEHRAHHPLQVCPGVCALYGPICWYCHLFVQ